MRIALTETTFVQSMQTHVETHVYVFATLIIGGHKMLLGPQQGAAPIVLQHSLEAVLDAFVLVIGVIFSIISAEPSMKGFCNGQDIVNLSDSLGFLRSYPCEGSAVSRAYFLAQYSPQILIYYLRDRGQDVWLTAFLSFWLLRVVSRLCLPQCMYSQLAAPCFTIAARAAPLVLLLAAGRQFPLSSAAWQFVFRGQGFFDAIVSVIQPVNFPHAEILFSIFSVSAVGLLAAWHGHSAAENSVDGGFNDAAAAARMFVAKVVLQRAALLVAVHWLFGRFLHHRRWRTHDGGLRTQTSVTEQQPTCVVSAMTCQHHFLEHGVVMQQGQQRSSLQFLQSANGALRPQEKVQGQCTGESLGPKACGQCTGEHCQMLLHSNSCDMAAATTAEPAVVAESSGGSFLLAGINEGEAHKATARAVPAASCTPPVAADGSALSHGAIRTIPYKSPIRRRTVRIKIPFGEPEDISPGYVERLEDLVAKRGMCLSGVYVRSGCIEMLLDLGMDTQHGVPEVPFAGRQLWSKEFAAGSGGGSGGKGDAEPGDAGHLHLLDDLSSDTDSILRALGIDSSKVPRNMDELEGRDIDMSSIVLGHAATHQPGSAAETFRILALSPRVLLQEHSSPASSVHTGDVAQLSALVSCADGWVAAMSGDGGGSDVSAARQPPPLPEVLVRAQGVYFRSNVAVRKTSAVDGDGDGYGAGDGRTWLYQVDLLELPRHAGTVLLEFRWEDRLTPAVPLLIVHDAAVAAELQAATSNLSSGGSVGNVLDDFLLDLGAWMAQSAIARASPTASNAGLQRAIPQGSVDALAAHLLRYAEACGWTATAASIREGMDFVRSAAAASCSSSLPPVVKVPPPPGPGQPPQSTTVRAPAKAAGSVSLQLMRRPRPLLLTALLTALDWCALAPKDEAAYQAYAAPRILAYSHVIQAVEVMSLFALLFRARNQLLDPGNLTTLAGCAVGTFTAAAWPLLRRSRWEELVNAAKIPRYCAYMLAKLMIGRLGFPAPPGVVPYQLGYAMLIMEGVLLPFSCLLSPRTALILALVKFPAGIGMMLRSGATTDPVRAAILCFRVVLAAFATTLACHTYLRYSYTVWVAAPTAAASAHRATATTAVATAVSPAKPLRQRREAPAGLGMAAPAAKEAVSHVGRVASKHLRGGYPTGLDNNTRAGSVAKGLMDDDEEGDQSKTNKCK